MSGAHEGGIFSVCVLKDGTMVSGGGKDRKVVLWGHDYRKQAEMEVREGESPVYIIFIDPFKGPFLWGLSVNIRYKKMKSCKSELVSEIL